jgi:hypothetical protein
MRTLKLLVAVLLLPAAAALTLGLGDVARILLRPAAHPVAVPGANATAAPSRAGSGGAHHPGFAFGAGYALCLVVFAFLPRPARAYVLGHELTHALWALLMGARVSGLQVRKTGGQVMTSKSNWLITLAPYFFPFYAMLFIALFSAAHWVWNLERYRDALFFLVGFGWSFHVTFTLLMLLTVRQPDVKAEGLLFSLVVIYSMNLLAIMLTAALLAESLAVADLARALGGRLVVSYGWTLDKLLALCQYAAAWFGRR